MKYIRKGIKDNVDITPEQLAQYTFTAETVKKDTTIDTVYGEILVTAGNCILTDHTGAKVGITHQDLHSQYDKED